MKSIRLYLTFLSAFGVFACGGSSDDGGTDSTATTTRTTTGAVEAADVSQLGLTGALSLDLPSALEDSSGSLRLQSGQKSIEACLIRESAKQLVTQISMASSLLCHIEAEGNNIPWNTPVILDFSDMEAAAALAQSQGAALQEGLPEGPGDIESGDDPFGDGSTEDPTTDTSGSFQTPVMGIYADDSDGNNVAVYVCEGDDEDSMELVQSFVIKGSKSVTVDGEDVEASKGTINISMSDDTMGTFKGAIGFDNRYTSETTSAMKLEVNRLYRFFLCPTLRANRKGQWHDKNFYF